MNDMLHVCFSCFGNFSCLRSFAEFQNGFDKLRILVLRLDLSVLSMGIGTLTTSCLAALARLIVLPAWYAITNLCRTWRFIFITCMFCMAVEVSTLNRLSSEVLSLLSFLLQMIQEACSHYLEKVQSVF